MKDESSVGVDFIRFLGRRVADPEIDALDCKVHNGGRNLGYRSDASLLAITNRFGALFFVGSNGLQWAWLEELRQRCKPGNDTISAEEQLHTVAWLHNEPPFAICLNADESLLLAITASSPPNVSLFDVQALLAHR